MLCSEEYKELKRGKRCYTSIERTKSENSSKKENATWNSSENVEGEVSQIQTLTQEAVN